MGAHKKFNIIIIVLSAIAIFLQTLILSISTLYETKIFQIIVAILNAALVAIQSVQLNLKKIRSALSSRTESPRSPNLGHLNIERTNHMEDI